MDKEFLRQVSVLAESECLISNKKFAEELMRIQNPNCDVVLASVSASHCCDVEEVSSVRDFSYVWYDRNAKENENNFLPVFFSESDEIPAVSDIFEIDENDIFCNEGMVYYAEFSGDNVVIRRLNMLYSQEIVEKIYSDTDPNAVIEDIFLINIKDVTREGMKYLMTCWYIIKNDGYIEYMPMFLDDVALLAQYDLPSLVCEEIKLAQRFSSHDKYFSLQKDVQGKIFVQREANFTLLVNEKVSTKNSKHTAKIIHFKPKNGG